MSAFVDYKINQLDSDNKLNINNDDIVAVSRPISLMDIAGCDASAHFIHAVSFTGSSRKSSAGSSFRFSVASSSQLLVKFTQGVLSRSTTSASFLSPNLVQSPCFIEQTKLVTVGKRDFLRFQFHPPAPELTHFRCRFHVDAYSQTIEKESIIFALTFTNIRA